MPRMRVEILKYVHRCDLCQRAETAQIAHVGYIRLAQFPSPCRGSYILWASYSLETGQHSDLGGVGTFFQVCFVFHCPKNLVSSSVWGICRIINTRVCMAKITYVICVLCVPPTCLMTSPIASPFLYTWIMNIDLRRHWSSGTVQPTLDHLWIISRVRWKLGDHPPPTFISGFKYVPWTMMVSRCSWTHTA